MTPRCFIAPSLLLVVASAATAAPTSDEAARRILAKSAAAFERAEPVELTDVELQSLKSASSASAPQAALYRRLPEFASRQRALRAARSPALPYCPEIPAPAKDPNGCVTSAVRAVAAGLGIVAKDRVDAVAGLYLGLYLGPKDASPAEVAAAQERMMRAQADPRLTQRSAERMRRVMGQAGALASPRSDAPDGVDPTPHRRTVEQAISEARRGGSPLPATLRKAAPPPSLSERLAASAAEDEENLKRGQDDGTVGTAIGRSVTQVKKTASSLLSYFTSGETWKRTGQGLVEMVSNPGETARFMPGALKAAGAALWHGVKADISNASDEVGKFIDNPTPYRSVAMVGSVALAVSNAFIVGGGAKTAVRQGAKVEIAAGARQAERLAKDMIGAVDESLDFTVHAAPKASQYQTATRQWRAKAPDGTFSVEAGELKGRIGVDSTVYDEVEQVGRQRGSDCARFGITTCAIANGTSVTKAEVEKAAETVMIRNSRDSVTGLEGRLRELKATGEPTADAEKALVEARSQLVIAEVGGSTYYGLDFGSIGGTLREMQMPHRSLGVDREALTALRRGEVTPTVLDFQRRIDAELVKGNAVMAALYTGSDGAHAQHAVTILGKGRDGAGRLVYEIYDSNVGRVAQIPTDAVHPFGAVVVGKL